jgi:hypothetical protein
MTTHHIAQVNIARMLAPLDDPIMADFVANLARINQLAEAAPGFVWRLTTPAGDATTIRAFDDPYLIVNMSIWQDINALYQYTYYTAHAEVYRRRAEWFSKLDTPHMALWYVPATPDPTPALLGQAQARLAFMAEHGPTPLAFTFKQRFTLADFLARTAHTLPEPESAK